ncbi:MAG: NYN domain-containing protein [Termitinemataceae bacterium]|nr:MAG: NYN domain-containing protein [Termitinemataceae bacterium]
MPLLPFSKDPFSSESQAKLAVLIDADNAQAVCIEGLLDEIAKYGVASVKRIYGDWTSVHLRSWKDKLLEHAIQPIQQFSYTTGKNATDSAMIIDAMDLLYSDNLDGFCLISSDSDFTRLAARIRESGLKVYGFGEEKTPRAFVSVCDKFIYTEILRNIQEETEDANGEEDIAKSKKHKKFKIDHKLTKLLRDAVEDIADESGWASLASIGQKITNRSTDFDARNYGFKKLGDLFRAIPDFEIDERSQENSIGKQIYIRCKK